MSGECRGFLLEEHSKGCYVQPLGWGWIFNSRHVPAFSSLCSLPRASPARWWLSLPFTRGQVSSTNGADLQQSNCRSTGRVPCRPDGPVLVPKVHTTNMGFIANAPVAAGSSETVRKR